MSRLFSISMALTTFLLMDLPSFAQPTEGGGRTMRQYWEWGHMFAFSGGLMMVLIWGAIIFLLFVLVRALNATHHGPHLPPHRTASEILKERFAKGEIDKEEYEERRRLLDR